jgi:ketosteroid isomerase-like protein
MENAKIPETDKEILGALNAQFIQNFLTQDVKRHSSIIHPDFVCIESNGSIISREVYLKNWATDHDNSGYTSFTFTDEHIRIFGNTALVRAKTVYTKNIDGKKTTGYTIYTDTYLKENGEWKCVQVQITPVTK